MREGCWRRESTLSRAHEHLLTHILTRRSLSYNKLGQPHAQCTTKAHIAILLTTAPITTRTSARAFNAAQKCMQTQHTHRRRQRQRRTLHCRGSRHMRAFFYPAARTERLRQEEKANHSGLPVWDIQQLPPRW